MKPEHLFVRTRDVIYGSIWQRFPVINVDKINDIPCDYPGPMGVPITYIDKYRPGQFEILGTRGHLKLNGGREPYQRIIIRNLKPRLPEVIDLIEWFDKMGVPIDVQMIKDAEKGDRIRPEYRAGNE